VVRKNRKQSAGQSNGGDAISLNRAFGAVCVVQYVHLVSSSDWRRLCGVGISSFVLLPGIWRTIKSARRFSPRLTQRVRPRAKATAFFKGWQSRYPCQLADNAVVMWFIASSGFARDAGDSPCPRSTTIIVSPMARLAASNTAPTMPGSAAGSTNLGDGFAKWVCPDERPSRIDCGNRVD